jgi:hypothetical protein
MVMAIIIPEINTLPKNTKDAVISILTSDWPLTLREIFFRIKKKYGYSSSYQAVYKAVNELLQEQVLTKKSMKYEINIEWIKKLQSFTDIVETNYYAKEKIQSLSGLKDSKHKEDIAILNFETIFDAEKYLYYFMKSELFKSKNDIVCLQESNEWKPMFYLRAEYNYYARLQEKGHKFYFLCSSSTQIEQKFAQFYKKIGINFKFTKEKFSTDNLIFSDYFIQIFIPEELKKKMENLLEKNDSLTILKEVLSKKSSIRIVITKDKNLAKDLKNQFQKKF